MNGNSQSCCWLIISLIMCLYYRKTILTMLTWWNTNILGWWTLPHSNVSKCGSSPLNNQWMICDDTSVEDLFKGSLCVDEHCSYNVGYLQCDSYLVIYLGFSCSLCWLYWLGIHIQPWGTVFAQVYYYSLIWNLAKWLEVMCISFPRDMSPVAL